MWLPIGLVLLSFLYVHNGVLLGALGQLKLGRERGRERKHLQASNLARPRLGHRAAASQSANISLLDLLLLYLSLPILKELKSRSISLAFVGPADQSEQPWLFGRQVQELKKCFRQRGQGGHRLIRTVTSVRKIMFLNTLFCIPVSIRAPK